MKQLIFIFLFILMISSIFAVDFKVNGVYTAWVQSQHEFLLGAKIKGEYKYDHNYVVQMLRFNVQGVANENLKFVTRFDIAQGWWGVDNTLKSAIRDGQAGGSALFDYKGTNFLFHVDQAYVDFNIPDTPIGVRIGRMWYGLGNKIILDNNYDGIQVDIKNVVGEKLTFGWAKVSEGTDDLSDEPVGPADQRNFSDARDADLFTLNFHGTNESGDISYDVFGLYYKDGSIKDMNAYVPDHFQFFKTRFSPQITSLTAFGAAATYKMDKLTINGEFNYLTGKDDVKNVDTTDTAIHGDKQMWDINDGNLSGYNLYLKGTYAATDKLKVGGIFGMGSGDDDLTKGAGNVNKLRTSGFFYITEIWEDSIMPDEEGITPQGLGAPNVRAYRELENTTIVQVNADYKLFPKFSTFLSFSYIMATQPIANFAKTGAPDPANGTADDIGSEIDFKFTYKMYDELALILRGGYFMPGDAASYLIGAWDSVNMKTYSEPAYELKGMVLYKF